MKENHPEAWDYLKKLLKEVDEIVDSSGKIQCYGIKFNPLQPNKCAGCIKIKKCKELSME